MQNNALLNDLIPLSKFNEFYTFPTVGALRQMMFRKKNGIEKIRRTIGTRVYISISAFDEWVKEQNGIL